MTKTIVIADTVLNKNKPFLKQHVIWQSVDRRVTKNQWSIIIYLALEKRFKHTREKSEHHINEYTINEKQTNISKIKLDKKKVD